MSVRGPYDSSSATTPPRTLGERIKALRVLQRKTQAEVAEALGSDQATVSLWERDRARPAGASLAGIAGYFGTTPQALETGTAQGPALESQEMDAPLRVDLPALPKGGVMAVDLEHGSDQPLDPMGAMSHLMAALRSGRRVWIVTE
jgi:transcriptional regulator with XRE-family HTH domain